MSYLHTALYCEIASNNNTKCQVWHLLLQLTVAVFKNDTDNKGIVNILKNQLLYFKANIDDDSSNLPY